VLNASEARYRTLLEGASDGILVVDKAGSILLANTRLEEMLGKGHQKLNGTPVWNLLYTGGDKDKEGTANDAFLSSAMPAGETHLFESQFVREDGEPLDVELSARRVDTDRVQYIVRDITERKREQAERERYVEKLTVLHQVDAELSEELNIAYVMSLALDAAVRLSWANSGFIGLVENNQIELKQAIGHYAAQTGQAISDMPVFKRLLEDRKARRILAKNNGDEPPFIDPETQAQLIIPLLSYERLIGVLNLETNKPERFTDEVFDFIKLIATRAATAVENAQLYKIAQDQLIQLQELYDQVSALERIKTDMIRIAAHDLRNPVGVIIGYLELIQMQMGEGLNENHKRAFQAMERSARRMEKITTDILSLERIENIQFQTRQRLSLSDLIDEVFRELENQARSKNQQYKLTLPTKSVKVHGDEAQLREAAANLINNAIKYTPEQGSIVVSLETAEGNVMFTVQDTGYGIPDDQQINLFQPFFRAQSDETEDIEGTGLGLHLVKNIVERLDGQMIFESTYGKGSVFGFKLPAS
jgi:PAS domain S-box-containing protein